MASVARIRARVLLAVAPPAAPALVERLEAERHGVLCASNTAEITRILEAMQSGRWRPPDLMVIDARLLTERAHWALRSLRARDRSLPVFVIADDTDATAWTLARALDAAVLTDASRAAEVEVIVGSAATSASSARAA
jgi:DNA-binding response OmpR family regulator